MQHRGPTARYQNRTHSSSDNEGSVHGQGRYQNRKKSVPLSPQQISLFMMMMTCFAINLDLLVAAPNLSDISRSFNLADSERDSHLGAMVQLGFYMIAGLFSILSGPVIDVIDRARLLSGICGLSATLSCFSGIVPNGRAGFFYFFLIRIACGISVGATLPTAFSLLADLVPASKRTTSSAFVTTSCAAGAAIGQAISGFTSSLSWRIPYFITATISICICVLSLIVLQDPREVVVSNSRTKSIPSVSPTNTAANAWLGGQVAEQRHSSIGISMEDLNWSIFATALEIPTNRWIFAQSLPGCVGWSCIATFLPDFLHTDLGYTVKTATGLMGIFGISGLIFSIGGSTIGQSLYNKDRARLPIFVATCTAMGAVPLMMLVLVGGVSSFFAIVFAALGGVAAATGPNLKGMLMNANPSSNRASVFSLFSLVDNIGKGLGPSVLVLLTWTTGGNRAAAFAIAFSLWFLTAWIQSGLSDCFVSDVVALEVQRDDNAQREPFDLLHIYHSQVLKD